MKYVTRAPDAQWVEKQAQALDGAAQLSLTGEKFQTVRGFGGCFNELSAIALRAVQELALSLPLLIVCHPVLAFLHRKFTL